MSASALMNRYSFQHRVGRREAVGPSRREAAGEDVIQRLVVVREGSWFHVVGAEAARGPEDQGASEGAESDEGGASSVADGGGAIAVTGLGYANCCTNRCPCVPVMPVWSCAVDTCVLSGSDGDAMQ